MQRRGDDDSDNRDAPASPPRKARRREGGLRPEAISRSHWGLLGPGSRGSAGEAEADIDAEFSAPSAPPAWRPVTIVDARAPKPLELRVEVPVEDMAKIASRWRFRAARGRGRSARRFGHHSSAAGRADSRAPLDDGVRQQPPAGGAAGPALNELAGEALVRSHHGSIARPKRVEIEDALKAGRLPALVATSSLELGVDMGAVDLVIQIEAPPSVATGMQRIGRAGHQSAASHRRHFSQVPRRPGRVRGGTAAMTGRGRVDALSAESARRAGAADRRDGGDGPVAGRRGVEAIRRAAPFAELPRERSKGCSTCCRGGIRRTNSPSCGRG